MAHIPLGVKISSSTEMISEQKLCIQLFSNLSSYIPYRTVDTTSQDGYPIRMPQPSLFAPLSYTVSEITRHVRLVLEGDPLTQEVWVIGEVSNLSQPRSGHIYFTLKDETASLRCVIWRSAAARLHFTPQNGGAVEAHGSIGVYEAGGQYQLYVTSVRPAGEGLLFQEYMRLKEQLESEGLFDEEIKRPIPSRPCVVGIVTSPTGAALQDMLNTLQFRFPLVEVILAPTAVQGEAAPSEIVQALEDLNKLGQPDVIIIGRGGGSLEDLWAFNDERVVRAVASSAAPVISGVGHETDFTLTDFAADLRAPTPTGAAVMAVPDIADLKNDLREAYQRLVSSQLYNLDIQNRERQEKQEQLLRASPLRRIQNDRQRLDEFNERTRRGLFGNLLFHRTSFEGTANRLRSLNPQSVLMRGYAVAEKLDGTLLYNSGQVQISETIQLRLAEGSLMTQVEEILPPADAGRKGAPPDESLTQTD
jgi:exodeoxyribonuclease VII large subunit